MSKKVICESCGTIFKEEVVKDMNCCPVCGVSFDDDIEDDNMEDMQSEEDAGDSLLYFDEITTSFKEHPEFNGVRIYCSECGEMGYLWLDQFDKLVDEKYIILKKGIIVTCKGCGKKHTARKIFYKKKDHYVPPLPHCSVCDSIMLRKISKTSKFVAVATHGTLSLPYTYRKGDVCYG